MNWLTRIFPEVPYGNESESKIRQADLIMGVN